MRTAIVLAAVLMLTPAGAAADMDTTALRSSFGDGIWRVRKDIRPGMYRTAGGRGCYWAILADFRGDIVENNITRRKAPQVVTILRSDVGFESVSCGTWRRISP